MMNDTAVIEGRQTVRDVLIHHPAAGPIFLQLAPMFSAKPGELYLRYEALTLEQYAAVNRISLEGLLKLLNAAIEDEDRPSARETPDQRGPAMGTVGYTGSYREPDPDVELAPVVGVQTARGPE